MFIGREKELRQLNAELSSWKRKTAVLVYGKRRVGKSIHECKYFNRPMTIEECRQEKEQLDSIKGITVFGVGFICTGGFDFEGEDDFELIDGKTLYFNE